MLRNAGRLDIPKTRLVPSYNSFLPKTIREWNSLILQGGVGSTGQRLSNATSIDAFKEEAPGRNPANILKSNCLLP